MTELRIPSCAGRTVRYTMFGNDGSPLRAACTLELQEARITSALGAVKQAGFDAVKAMGRAALEATDLRARATS